MSAVALCCVEPRCVDAEIVVARIAERQAVPLSHVGAACPIDAIQLGLGSLRDECASSPRCVRCAIRRGAWMKTRSTSGRAPNMAEAPRPTMTTLPCDAYSRTASCTARSSSSSNGSAADATASSGVARSRLVQEAFAERPLRVFVGFDGLRRDAQTLGDDDRELLIDVLVTERVGNPLSRSRGHPIRIRWRSLRITGEGVRSAERCRVLPIVETRELRKVFRTRKRTPGTLGALRSFFSRAYEDRVAVDDVTFALEPGELVGYIGPNGAGKSTTIKMLTGILVPTSGEVRVAGLVPWKSRKENARNIGVIFGQRSQLYWDLPLGRIVRAPARDLRRPARPVSPQSQRVRRNPRDGELHADARAPAFAGAAHARRLCGGAASQPEDRLSRRTDDRTRRGRQGSDPRVHRAHQCRTRRDDRSHDSRPGRRRAALPAYRLDRPRKADLRRRHRANQERVRKISHAGRAFQRSDRGAAARRARSSPGSRIRARAFDSTAICSGPICSCGKRANATASKTSAWKSRISNRSSGESTSKGTAADRRRTRRDLFQRDKETEDPLERLRRADARRSAAT